MCQAECRKNLTLLFRQCIHYNQTDQKGIVHKHVFVLQLLYPYLLCCSRSIVWISTCQKFCLFFDYFESFQWTFSGVYACVIMGDFVTMNLSTWHNDNDILYKGITLTRKNMKVQTWSALMLITDIFCITFFMWLRIFLMDCRFRGFRCNFCICYTYRRDNGSNEKPWEDLEYW